MVSAHYLPPGSHTSCCYQFLITIPPEWRLLVTTASIPYWTCTGRPCLWDETGHWVKFIVQRTAVTSDRPHGLSYSLTLHAPDGTRLVGFDNAHPVQDRRRSGKTTTRQKGSPTPASDSSALRVHGCCQAARRLLEHGGQRFEGERSVAMKTLQIGIASYEQMKARTLAIAPGRMQAGARGADCLVPLGRKLRQGALRA